MINQQAGLNGTYPVFSTDVATGRSWVWFNGLTDLSQAGWFIYNDDYYDSVLTMWPSGFQPVFLAEAETTGSNEIQLFEFAANTTDSAKCYIAYAGYFLCTGTLYACPGGEGSGLDLYLGPGLPPGPKHSPFGDCIVSSFYTVSFCDQPPIESDLN